MLTIIKDWQKNRRRIAFDNLQFGNDRPSDLDGLMLLTDKSIFIEFKCGESEVGWKQRWMLKTQADDARAAGKKGVALVARYYDRDPDNVVDGALCLVTESYADGKWCNIRAKGMSLREVMEHVVKGTKNNG